MPTPDTTIAARLATGGWRLRIRVPLAMASGFITSLAFAPADIRFVAFIGLVPLLLALRGARVRDGAIVGAAFGAAFFGVVVVWVTLVGWIAWIALVVLCLSWTLLFGSLAAPLSRGGPIGRIVGIPLLFTGLEIARARYPLGGFAFATLGSSQHSGLPFLPLARVGGEFAITLALVMLNAVVAEALLARRRTMRITWAAVAAAVCIAPARLPLGAPGRGDTINIAVVQGSVPRHYFAGLRRGRVGPEDQVIIDNHLRLTGTLADDPPDLIVWPENSFDRDPFTDPVAQDALAEALTKTGTPMLVGAIVDGPDTAHFYNSALLFAPDANLAGRYDKMHLVPFGEYVPWRWARDVVPALKQVPYDGIPGAHATTLRYGDLPPIGSVICFESSYPDLVRRFVRNGAQIIIVETNNATFERSALARQHLAQSQMRAVELGRPVVHAAIAGVSAVIRADGGIVQEAGLFVPSIVRQNVTAATGLTPYAAYGTQIELGFAGGAALAALASILIAVLRRRPDELPDGEPDEFWDAPGSDPAESVPVARPLVAGTATPDDAAVPDVNAAAQDPVPSSSESGAGIARTAAARIAEPGGGGEEPDG